MVGLADACLTSQHGLAAVASPVHVVGEEPAPVGAARHHADLPVPADNAARELVSVDALRQHRRDESQVPQVVRVGIVAEEEVLKEQRVSPFNDSNCLSEEAYARIYGATMTELLKRFRREKHYPQLHSMGFGDLKEFTYWLFKYRLKECDKARVASDTKRALNELRRQWALSGRKRGAAGGSI